jgi:hypothetical protein
MLLAAQLLDSAIRQFSLTGYIVEECYITCWCSLKQHADSCSTSTCAQ